MTQALLRSLVWADYRLAILFLVSIPLTLLIWSLFAKADAIRRLLIIYWRVSSLLAITVYLMIANAQIGFLTAVLARFLIPLGLWFWVDLNEEVHDQRSSSLKLGFTAWRWAVSVYCLVGAIATIPSLRCAFDAAAFQTEFCKTWLEAPNAFYSMFHASTQTARLGLFAFMGLIAYGIYLAYFVIFRLGKQGRTAVEQ
jgi:hypothetical protein